MSESSNIDFFTKLDWTKSTEDLLISWADIALCYTWIFDKSYRHYREDGPAVEHATGYREWWINGKLFESLDPDEL